MVLRRLSLLHFRNYAEFQYGFAPGLNYLVGPNAQGKSNLLEAGYLLATTKSMRGGRDTEMVAWDRNVAVVTGEVGRELTYDVELEVCLSRNEPKSLAVNRARVPRVTEFVGQLKAVAFSSADIDIVRGEPARRRRFLDLEISQASPAYCHTLACYRKVLDQRTRLLKVLRERGGPRAADREESLAEWTAQLVRYGARLVERRAAFLRRLAEFAQPIHALLTDQREHLGLAYESSFALPRAGGSDETAGAFAEALAGVRHEELRRGVCLIGPHRDDLSFLFNGREARVYGSQAQQRSVVLSARLAELELLREECGESPVCLLDDVLSELDDRRREHLFEIITGAGQVLLTGTDEDALPEGARRAATLHEVREGSIVGEPSAAAA